MSQTTSKELDPTPPRPAAPINRPSETLPVAVDVETAYLANPLVAASRLLVSEADGLAHVAGDEEHFEVAVALPDRHPETVDHA